MLGIGRGGDDGGLEMLGVRLIDYIIGGIELLCVVLFFV